MLDIFTKEGFMSFLYFLPALLISLSIHEYAHAYVAYKLGDKSQKAMGRLTMDPIAHIDWLGFLAIALVGIGWGKPVMVDDTNFKKKNKGNMLVALAGPVSNLILALAITIVVKLLMVFGLTTTMMTTTFGAVILDMLMLTISFNIIFAIFNMIPIPPFDGSKVLLYYLPYKFKGIIYKMEQYAMIILIVMFVTKIHMYIITPIYGLIFWLLSLILGL